MSTSGAKFTRPGLPRAHIARNVADLPRVLVCVAPAGFGKSTLLAAWAEHQGARWYSCSPGESVTMLAAGIVRSIESGRKESGLADEIGSMPEGAAPSRLAAMVGDHLEALDVGALALDDLQDLATDDAARAFLDLLVARCAQVGRGIALASRRSLSLPALTRLLVDGTTVTLRPDDLRFDAEQTATYLREGFGVVLSPVGQELLMDRAGGWPALLAVAGRWLASLPEERRAAAIAALGADMADVYDYVASQVIAELGEDEQDFLHRASVAESFSQRFADAVAAGPALQLLHGLVSDQLLHAVPDPDGTRYELHPLLRSVLRTRLSTVFDRTEERQMLILAGEVATEEERWEEAFSAWHEAGEHGRIVERLMAWELVPVEWRPHFGHWLERIPEEELERAPRLILRWAIGHASDLRRPEALRLVEWAERCSRAHGEEAVADALAGRAVVRYYLRDPGASADAFELERLEPRLTPWQRIICTTCLGHHYAEDVGDLGTACAYYRRAMQAAEATESVRMRVLALTNLADALISRGELNESRRLLAQAMRVAGGPADAYDRMLIEGVSFLLAVQCADPRAEDHAAEASRLGALLGSAVHREIGTLHWIMCLGEQGRWEEARRALDALKADTIDAELMPVLEAFVAAQSGGVERAVRALSLLAEGDLPIRAAVTCLLFAVRIARAIDRVDVVAPVLETWSERMSRCGADLLEFQLRCALCLAQQVPSRNELKFVLAFARERGLGDMLCRRWPVELPGALHRAIATRVEPEYASALLDRFGQRSLRVQLFGRIAASVSGRTLCDTDWRRPRARAILAFLACRGERGASADEMCEAFWPDQPADTSRNSLHVAISHLRKALEPDLAPKAASRFLVVDGERYHLEPGPAGWIDLSEFRLALARLEDARVPVAERIAAGELALALSRQEFLLEYRLEDWAVAEQEVVQVERRGACVELGRLLAAVGRLADAASAFTSVLRDDPLDEEAARDLMKVRAAQGRVDQVRRTYDRLRDRLRDELNTEPSESTRALARQLCGIPSTPKAR